MKSHFKNLSKGSQSIIDFLQTVKAWADELAILGAPIDKDDLTEKILDGLGVKYKELIRVVKARDNSISFSELHEKLINFEVSLEGTKSEPSHFPASANPASYTNLSWRSNPTSGNNNTNWRPSPNSGNNIMGWHPLPNNNNRFPMPSNVSPNSNRSG